MTPRTTIALALGAAALCGATPAAASGPGAPHAPVALRVSATTATSVTIAWRNRSARTRPRVGVRRAGSPLWLELRRPRGAASYTRRGLVAGARYRFRVRACRRGLCSRWTRTVLGVAVAAGGAGGGPPPGTGGATISGCPIFPADNPWNRDVSGDPVDPNSNAYVASINAGATHLHPDFGSNPTYGIPYVVVPGDQTPVPITFNEFGDQSDVGPYPVPPTAPVEAGSDRHVLVLQPSACRLYELYHAHYLGGAAMGWSAGSGAAFDLRSNALRPDTWTSADAAGLPILAGLVRYDEVQSGHIDHALRFTVGQTQRGFIHPATHFASSSSDPSLPPMGLRLRLKASFDTSGFPHNARVILEALKRYGMMVADNGGDWFISGATDSRWDDTDLDTLKTVPGSAFEAVQSGTLHTG